MARCSSNRARQRRPSPPMQMLDLADVLRRVHQLEADPFAMTACREAPALDDRDLMRHVGVLRIVGDAIDARFRDDLSRFELLVPEATPCKKVFPGTGPCTAMFRGSGGRF